MSRRRIQTLARRVAGQQPPAWINELEALLDKDPRLSMSAATDWFGVNGDTISCWLRAFGREDLLILLRHSKRPSDWADLAARALDADPAPSLAGFATRYGTSPAAVEQGLIKAGRTDLLDRFDRPVKNHRPAEWAALADQALQADPGLTLDRFAAQHQRTPEVVRRGLTKAGRRDLVDRFRQPIRRTPTEWAVLADQALHADPTLTLARFAAQQHRHQQTIRRALRRAGRDDLLAALRSRRKTCSAQPDDERKEAA